MGASRTVFTPAICISSWGRPRGALPCAFACSSMDKPPGAAHGLDIDDHGHGTVTAPRLYQLIRQPQPITDRQFEIAFLDAGVEAFAFTFG